MIVIDNSNAINLKKIRIWFAGKSLLIPKPVSLKKSRKPKLPGYKLFCIILCNRFDYRFDNFVPPKTGLFVLFVTNKILIKIYPDHSKSFLSTLLYVIYFIIWGRYTEINFRDCPMFLVLLYCTYNFDPFFAQIHPDGVSIQIWSSMVFTFRHDTLVPLSRHPFLSLSCFCPSAVNSLWAFAR